MVDSFERALFYIFYLHWLVFWISKTWRVFSIIFLVSTYVHCCCYIFYSELSKKYFKILFLETTWYSRCGFLLNNYFLFTCYLFSWLKLSNISHAYWIIFIISDALFTVKNLFIYTKWFKATAYVLILH